MFTQSAKYYDALYGALNKDYRREAVRVEEIVAERCRSGGKDLLDIACGTGKHIEMFRERFACEGLDVDRTMLEIARARNPGVTFHLADMIGYNLGRRFDAIVCLFSSIGYVPNVQRLDQTLATAARHLKPGGVIIVEPWLKPEDAQDGSLNALYVDEPDLKVARMTVSRLDGNVSILNFHYMVASRDGIRTFTEPHRLTLFTDEEYRAAFTKARLFVDSDDYGLCGRGLYVGYSRPE
jgi:SAM-dependent methyltransferase